MRVIVGSGVVMWFKRFEGILVVSGDCLRVYC